MVYINKHGQYVGDRFSWASHPQNTNNESQRASLWMSKNELLEFGFLIEERVKQMWIVFEGPVRSG